MSLQGLFSSPLTSSGLDVQFRIVALDKLILPEASFVSWIDAEDAERAVEAARLRWDLSAYEVVMARSADPDWYPGEVP